MGVAKMTRRKKILVARGSDGGKKIDALRVEILYRIRIVSYEKQIRLSRDFSLTSYFALKCKHNLVMRATLYYSKSFSTELGRQKDQTLQTAKKGLYKQRARKVKIERRGMTLPFSHQARHDGRACHCVCVWRYLGKHKVL
jgi:hypothetical protein